MVYSGSSGRIDFPVDSAPFTEKSFTWVASLTKLITSTCVMQLVEWGQVTLDEDLRGRVPELQTVRILREFDDNDKPVFEDNTNPITFRMLLSHTAGFSYEFADPVLLKWARADGRNVSKVFWTRKELTTPLRFAPGESFGYGVNTDWAGFALEAVTGQTLGAFAQANVFDQLGMTDTSFRPARLSHVAGRTVAHAQRNAEKGTLQPARWSLPQDPEVESGGGGLYSTAEDYAKLLRGLLLGRLLRDDTTKELFAPQLNDAQRELLQFIAFHPLVHNSFAPEFEKGEPISYGLGGLVNLCDVPGKRRAGSMAWSGIHCSRWVRHEPTLWDLLTSAVDRPEKGHRSGTDGQRTAPR